MEVADGFNFNIRYNTVSESLEMTFVVPDNTWFGIALGQKSMKNTDMIQVRADGVNSTFSDLYSTQEA